MSSSRMAPSFGGTGLLFASSSFGKGKRIITNLPSRNGRFDEGAGGRGRSRARGRRGGAPGWGPFIADASEDCRARSGCSGRGSWSTGWAPSWNPSWLST